MKYWPLIFLTACSPPPEQPELQSYAINPLCLFWCDTTMINDSTSPTVQSTKSGAR